MLSKRWFRLGACLTVAMAGSAMISSCTSGPRYGTDKTAFQQLTDDLGQSTSLTGAEPKNKGVKYNAACRVWSPPRRPRKRWSSRSSRSPARTIRSGSNRRKKPAARLVKDADDNSDKSNYQSPLATTQIEGGRRTTEEQTKAYREARAIQKGAYIDQRRSISDPPTEFRQVDDPSKLDDLGEPELKKMKKKKKEAAVAGSGKQWWNLLQ
jgi:hypothetical protein